MDASCHGHRKMRLLEFAYTLPLNFDLILTELMRVLPPLPKPIIKVVNHQKLTFLGVCIYGQVQYNRAIDHFFKI